MKSLLKRKFTVVRTTGAGYKRTKVTKLFGVVKYVKGLFQGDKIEVRPFEEGDKDRG